MLSAATCFIFTPALCTLASASNAPCGFEKFFNRNLQGPGIHKWRHYFSAYEQEFGQHCGDNAKPVNMLEIGIQSGGSMRMWRACFAGMLNSLVGVDINPHTKAWEKFGNEGGSKAQNVHVEIGSQADPAVFRRIKLRHQDGFDIVLDDGSHQSDHMVASFLHAWPLLRPGGVYLIEDIIKENVGALHDIILSAAHHPYQDSVRINNSIVDALYDNPGGVCCRIKPNGVQREVEYVKMYPMMLAIKKRGAPLDTLHAPRHGSQWIPNPYA